MLKELRVTIKGRPCSKKNSREARTMTNRKTGRKYTFTVPGENYEKFRTNAIAQLQDVSRNEKFGGMPVYVEYIFYRLGMSLQDGDNAQSSINDILQDKFVKIIDDDKQIYKWKGEIVPGCDEWKSEIYIRQLHCNKGEHDLNPETNSCDICGLGYRQILLFT